MPHMQSCLFLLACWESLFFSGVFVGYSIIKLHSLGIPRGRGGEGISGRS